jgi:enoyl-CoA hydratase
MDLETILVEDVNGVRWLTVNRPDKLNALNRQVVADLDAAVTAAAAAPEVRALVITGAGEKAFVAGADISEFVGLTPAEAEAMARRGQALLDRIEAFDRPVIAAINGFALGGGCELALACHLRLASANARFGQPEVKLGLIPGYGGTQRLPRLVGKGRALELILTGSMIDAATAASWGLVNRVTEPGALRQSVQQLAEQILTVSPSAVSRCLAAVRNGASAPLADALAAEAAQFGLCFGGEDMKEGTSAFLEKRQPAFTGR